jgi:hypothetical protein
MELTIKPNMTIAEVQEQFSARYPHLKIEFYSKPHDPSEGTPNHYKLDSSKTIDEVTGERVVGEVSLHGNMKTETLEDTFEQELSLYVQVFRKSGNVWLQTTKTDSWTLAEQERSAAERASV